MYVILRGEDICSLKLLVAHDVRVFNLEVGGKFSSAEGLVGVFYGLVVLESLDEGLFLAHLEFLFEFVLFFIEREIVTCVRRFFFHLDYNFNGFDLVR